VADVVVAAKMIRARLGASAVLFGPSGLLGPAGSEADYIHRQMAPADAPDPHVVFFFQAAEQDFSLVRRQADRLWSPQTWLIAAEAAASTVSGPLEQVADEIDALFQNPDPMPAGIISCRRVKPHMLPTFERGRRYERVGGIYAIAVAAGGP
jgi:hypothetical protein